MDRRDFIKATASAAVAAMVWSPFAEAKPKTGQTWKGWGKGHFQIHFIYTGVAESMFLIFPDGTTMLLDCGDFNAVGRGKLAVPVLPNPDRHSSEWIARYVERVNPHGTQVDYMMLSHYHSDHAGCRTFYDSEEIWKGEAYRLSGFAKAAKTLNFNKAFDRCYPEMDDPLPIRDEEDEGCVGLMKQFYQRQIEEKGMTVEKFQVGAKDQIRMVHNPAAYPQFSIRNLCGNGRIAGEDGKVKDLFAEFIERTHPEKVSENAMSLGMVISYGPFRFYTAGDFSASIKQADGTKIEIEDALAEVCGPADVAKINHHGHNSMTEKLIRALHSTVYVSCVWDQLHNMPKTLKLLDDRSIYPDGRILYSGIFPKERRAADEEKYWERLVEPACFEGSHIVLDVEPSGKKYSMTTLDASDESMRITSIRHFKTSAK